MIDISLRIRVIKDDVCLVKCPKCHKEILKPHKSLKNWFFHIEAYTCDECDRRFKVSKQKGLNYIYFRPAKNCLVIFENYI